MLDIKPVMHVDDEGHLIPAEKVRGRKKSLKALVDHMEETATEPVADQIVFISHGDCIEDAEYVARPRAGALRRHHVHINYVGSGYRRPFRPRHHGPVLPGQ